MDGNLWKRSLFSLDCDLDAWLLIFWRKYVLFLPGHYRELIQREDLNEQTDVSPQKLLILSTCDTSVLEDQPIEGSETFETWIVDEMSKKVLYNLCVKTIHKEALKEQQPLKWTRIFGPNFPKVWGFHGAY